MHRQSMETGASAPAISFCSGLERLKLRLETQSAVVVQSDERIIFDPAYRFVSLCQARVPVCSFRFTLRPLHASLPLCQSPTSSKPCLGQGLCHKAAGAPPETTSADLLRASATGIAAGLVSLPTINRLSAWEAGCWTTAASSTHGLRVCRHQQSCPQGMGAPFGAFGLLPRRCDAVLPGGKGQALSESQWSRRPLRQQTPRSRPPGA